MSVARKSLPSTARRLRPRAAADKNSVKSLAKGFRVLEAFSGPADEMTLSEIGRAAGLDAGTTFRILNTLVSLGYVARVGDGRRFRLTLKVLDLGFNAIAYKDQRALVRPVLASLVDETSEAASFAVLDGGDVLYIERVRAGLIRLGVDIRIGTTIPAALSAIGRAILAFLPDAAVERTLNAAPRQPLDMPMPALPRLLSELENIRRRGYVVQDSPFAGGLRILAVPVLDGGSYAIGAISVVAPTVRASEQQFKERALGPVLAAARNIARALQASGGIRQCS